MVNVATKSASMVSGVSSASLSATADARTVIVQVFPNANGSEGAEMLGKPLSTVPGRPPPGAARRAVDRDPIRAPGDELAEREGDRSVHVHAGCTICRFSAHDERRAIDAGHARERLRLATRGPATAAIVRVVLDRGSAAGRRIAVAITVAPARATAHPPSAHVAWEFAAAGHSTPQPPQTNRSLDVSMQVPSHALWPSGHAEVQAPARRDSLSSHRVSSPKAVPVPQCGASVGGSMHAPSHTI